MRTPPPLPEAVGAQRRRVAALAALGVVSIVAGVFLAAAVLGDDGVPVAPTVPSAVREPSPPAAAPAAVRAPNAPPATSARPTQAPTPVRPAQPSPEPTPRIARGTPPPTATEPAATTPAAPTVPGPIAPTAPEPIRPPAPEPPQPEAPNRPEVPRASPEPPPTDVISAAALPDATTARQRLEGVRDRSAAGTPLRTELDWLLRLGDLYDTDTAPPGRRETVRRALRANAWWFSGRGVPERAVVLRDPDGILLNHRAGYGFMVNPVATTGRWQGLNDDLEPQQLAEPLLTMGVPLTFSDRQAQVWEYFDVPTDPTAIRPGVSAMAQARVAQLMANAYARTSDIRFLVASREAVMSLAVPVDNGGARSMVADPPGSEPSVWFPERAYPGGDPWAGAALNGFMVTILNLRGTTAALRSGPVSDDATATADLAETLSDQAAASLERFLPAHDTGNWSLYGLNTPGRTLRNYRADVNYHCYHVRLLGGLARAFPGRGFATVATRWSGYVAKQGLECPAR